MKALMIVGLPASGKSMYIETIQHLYDAVFDDIYCDIENISYDSILISHPDFCKEDIRNNVKSRLESCGYDVDFLFFENDPEQCLKNAKRRKDKDVEGYIHYLSQFYCPPKVDMNVWNDWGVHESHCCSIHGCKYGDDDCPVATGKTHGIKCEDCFSDEERLKSDPSWSKLKAYLIEQNDKLALEKMTEIENQWG